MIDSIAFIGGEVMAEAMIGGLLEGKLVAPDHVVAAEPREKRRAELESRLHNPAWSRIR